MTKTTIDQIIKNPFYIGLQKFQGKLHEAIHERLIPTELFNEVNENRKGYKKHNAEIEFPLKGIVKNYHTKKPLLAQWKKKKYVYYCSHSREEYKININQNHIIKAFNEIINQYILPEEVKPFILNEIKDYFELYFKELKREKKNFSIKYQKTRKRLREAI